MTSKKLILAFTSITFLSCGFAAAAEPLSGGASGGGAIQGGDGAPGGGVGIPGEFAAGIGESATGQGFVVRPVARADEGQFANARAFHPIRKHLHR